MVVLFVSITLLIILFYGTIFFTEQTRKENKENERKMEFYNRDNFKAKPTIENYKTTYNS
jgi:ATP-dependent Zn protease